MGAYAFTAPPSGCTPESCENPLSVDFTNQTVSVNVTPTVNEHVANKEYVDNTVATLEAGLSVAGNRPTMITAQSSNTYNVGQAMRYCENLVTSCEKEWSPGTSGTTNVNWTNNCTETYDDWYLPTASELIGFSSSIYGFSSGITNISYLWTATVYDVNRNWILLRLSDGYWDNTVDGGSNYARCVR